MNDLKFEVGNEPLNEGLVQDLTFDEMEVIAGGALFALTPWHPKPGPDGRLPMACLSCGRPPRPPLR